MEKVLFFIFFEVLVQHDQIKSEILKQNALSLLINNCRRFNDRSQRLILESLGSMTFDAEAARLLRKDKQFISSVTDMQETKNNGIKKAAEKIIWNLIKGIINKKIYFSFIYFLNRTRKSCEKRTKNPKRN